MDKGKLYRPKSSAVISIHMEDTLLGNVATEAAIARQFPIETSHLIALTVASHAASMAYKIDFGGHYMPIGLYAVSEQPTGTAKTSTVSYLSDGIYRAVKSINETRKKKSDQIKKSAKDKKGELDPLEEETLLANQPVVAPLTDVTPESLDASLKNTQGWFMASSTEQALINVLVGSLYSSEKAGSANNDLLLKGFNAEHHASSRVTREGFFGMPHGGVLAISQEGVIDTILSSSKGTGLSERFLMLCEGNMLGNRVKSAYRMKPFYKNEFSDMLYNICMSSISNKNLDFSNLKPLRFSQEALNMSDEQMDINESNLADGGIYSASIFRGMFSKMDTQFAKVAATIHLTQGYDEKTEVSGETMRVAMLIVKTILMGVIRICEEKGFIGKSAEEETVEDYMSKNASGLNGKTLRQIQAALSQREIFRQYGNDKRAKIKDCIIELVSKGVLMQSITGKNKRETFRYVG